MDNHVKVREAYLRCFRELFDYCGAFAHKHLGSEKPNFVPRAEDILSLVIKTHCHIEKLVDMLLQEMVSSFDNHLHQLRFPEKLRLVQVLGLNGSWIEAATDINKLRNKYAHEIDYEFRAADVSKLLIDPSLDTADYGKVYLSLYNALLGITVQIVLEVTDQRLFPFLSVTERYETKIQTDRLVNLDHLMQTCSADEANAVRRECGAIIEDLITKYQVQE